MKEVAILIAVVIACVAFLWPREAWRNSWSGSDTCLAWRVERYGFFERDLRGPYVVSDKWCD